MILRGLLMLAKGDKAGLNEFSNSLESFTASLAPLIAFPLVGAGISVAAGQWQIAIIGFLSRVCAVLVLPVMTYEFARRFGRESLWPRTATALNWSFWMVVPMIFISAFAGALMVQAGLAMKDAGYMALGAICGYLLWYRWLIIRVGLGFDKLQAAALIIVSSLAIGLFSLGPILLDYAFYGRIVHY
jgi:hypothetical protein